VKFSSARQLSFEYFPTGSCASPPSLDGKAVTLAR
jgi:hypothetical protein